MSKKPELVMTLIIVFIGVLFMQIRVSKAQSWSGGTVHIRANGSIEPEGAPLFSADNITYTLTDSITASADGIVIERDDILLDGANFTIQGRREYSYMGILLNETANVTIRDIEVKTFAYGIVLLESSNISIVRNTFTNDGLFVFDSYQNTIEQNIVNGKPLVYLEDISDRIVDDAGQVILVNCRNITIENLDLSDTSVGVELFRTNTSKIINNSMTNSYVGVWLLYSVDSTITANSMTNNYYGIFLYLSLGSIIAENSITNITKLGYDETYGIRLSGSNCSSVYRNMITTSFIGTHRGIGIEGSSKNEIYENNLTKVSIHIDYGSSNNSIIGNDITNEGIWVYYSSGNTIIGNTVNREWIGGSGGIGISYSSNNLIYHNNFLNITYPVSTDSDSVNVWDDGYFSGGNYWSNYNGTDLNRDGVGDTPYIAYRPYDPPLVMNYPLMGMFHSFNTSTGYDVNLVSNSTLKDFQYFASNNTIRMVVSNMTASQTFGFVRICIPHTLMNDTYQVTIDGGEPHYVNYTLYDNGTHRWIYFSYQHSTLEIVIIPEFPSFLTLPLLMATTLLATTAYKRKRFK